jgi:hypothetical protein
MALDLIRPTAGMTASEVEFEINRGARFVVYQWAVSVLIMSFRRNSPVVYLKPGENAALKSLPWTILSLFVGWWGIPWGFIYTPQVIYKNLQGGADVTPYVLQAVRARPTQPPPPSFR